MLKQETIEFNNRASLHPQFEAGIEAILNVMKYRGTKPFGVMIIGNPGCGKTFLLDTIKRMHPEIFTRRKTEVPFVCIDSPPEITPSTIYSEILEAMGDECADEGTVKSLRRRIKKLTKNLDTKLLGIDEAHHFLPSSGLTKTSTVLKVIKWLMNNTEVPLVLAGKPDAKSLLDFDDQLKDRFLEVVKLESFSCVTLDKSLDSADFFDGLFSVFPRKTTGMEFLEESENDDGEIEYKLNNNFSNLLRFILATSGNPRLINKMLLEVIESTNKDDVLAIADFAEAWDKTLKSKMEFHFNPFTADYSVVKSMTIARGLYEE